MAIAGRQKINAAVTDILIGRGNPDVIRKIAANTGASISEIGFVKIIKEAKQDTELASAIANRKDIPDELQPFLNLLRA